MKIKVGIDEGNGTLRFETVKDAQPTRTKKPAWLKPFKFFTHRSIGAVCINLNDSTPDGAWTLTEAVSGRAVVKFKKSRIAAEREGFAKMEAAGEARVVAEILRRQRSPL